MKQILQNLRTGQIEIADVPCPAIKPGYVLIKSRASLVSTGTERMLVDFGKANWINKARQQPEKVRQVWDKIRTDGLMPTMEAVFSKLDEPLPLGYCNAGVVLAVGSGVTDIQPGDRVANNGPHAEVVCVPRHLCAKIPGKLTDEEGAFVVLGSIALQGIRLAQPSLGEKFMVFGLGLIGLVTVQLLRANGCQVLAVDMDEKKLRFAESFGAQVIALENGVDPIMAARLWTSSKGVDGAIITAAARDDAILHQAAQSCRKRGRIILVGVVNLNLQRNDFYEKELTFQVSCSYGPGRYDEVYEQQGKDYPIGFVRWTEQRNFEAILEAMGAGHLRVTDFITHRVDFVDVVAAYDQTLHNSEGLGIIIHYPEKIDDSQTVSFNPKRIIASGDSSVGVIGAGNFARMILLPALAKSSAHLNIVADINGSAASYAARKYHFSQATTDHDLILNNKEIKTVFILVGHHLHARFVCEALEAGKHVFVEKPLAIREEELQRIIKYAEDHPDRMIMVGFNRRFSQHIQKIHKLLARRSGPLCMTMTVNAGIIPPDHWVQDPDRGGGRIIGEGCHFIDLMSFIADSPVVSVSSTIIGDYVDLVKEDKMSISLTFGDGSIGTIHYFANGSKSYPKETLEIFNDGRVIRMENYRVTRGYGFKNFGTYRTLRQDKGHQAEIGAFINSIIIGGDPLIPFESLINVTRASFSALEAAKSGKTIHLTT